MLARFKHTTTDGMKLDPDGIWTSYVAAAEELHRLERQLTLEKNRVEQYHSAFERDAVHIFKQKTEIEVLRDQLYQLYIEIERLRIDAARYRFIRQDIGGLGVYIVNGNLEVLSLDEADKAIDASREAVGYE
jgi:chromosome segregation ATPase